MNAFPAQNNSSPPIPVVERAMIDLRDKTIVELREMEKQGVTVRFPGGETWTVKGARVRDLWRWYFNKQAQRNHPND